jgi:glycosyltransferase involved in cell wall biosynthesis
MSNKDKISIITCFLNVEMFLEEAIQSVIHQDYVNWELLLVDDGSTDGSTEIAKKYANEYPDKIFYYEHEGHVNLGLSISRNMAIGHSTGQYIAFLDGDDVWYNNFLSNIHNLMCHYSTAMVGEATEYWFSWNSDEKQDIVRSIGTRQDQIHEPPQLMLELYPLGKGEAPCLCALLIKKDVLIKYNGFEISFTGMYEDQVLLSKIYLHEPVYISSGCHNLYRQRQGSLVNDSLKYGRYYADRKKYLDWIKSYLDNSNIDHAKINKLVKKALLPYRYPMAYAIFYVLPKKGKMMVTKLLAIVKL